jgi:hypothetical protein
MYAITQTASDGKERVIGRNSILYEDLETAKAAYLECVRLWYRDVHESSVHFQQLPEWAHTPPKLVEVTVGQIISPKGNVLEDIMPIFQACKLDLDNANADHQRAVKSIRKKCESEFDARIFR